MERFVKWYFLQNKRLLKKYSFWLIIFLLPFLVGGMNILSREGSGILRIVLCMQNSGEELAAGIVDRLMEKEGVLEFALCEEERQARAMVADGRADAAWIFSGSFQEDLKKAAADKRCEAVVTVVEREDNVPLMFARQILTSNVYSDFSYMIYEDFIRDDMGLSEVSDTRLKEAYERMFVEGSLFQMEYPDGQREEETDYNYLVAPLRGILSIWFVLCGFAASLYFIQDEQSGVYARIAFRDRLWTAFGIHAAFLSDAAVILLAALRASGVFTTWRGEIGRLAILAGCTLVFCNLVRMLCGTPERLGACIPVLLMGMAVICPVFIHFREMKVIPYLLPPYYYLKSIHNVSYIYGMTAYTVVLFILCVLLFKIKNRNRN